MFYRFSSLRQLVVSIRLGRRAWLGAGYGSAVDAIERMAAAAGLMVSDVDPDAFNSVPALKGQCAVNDFIVDELEFDVLGWCDVRDAACGRDRDFLGVEVEALLSEARLAADAIAGRGSCKNVQIGECSGSCCASKLLDMSYWETVARQSRSKVLLDVADHLDVVAAALPESQRHQILEPRRLRSLPEMPRLIYGTAWKKERTEELVRAAASAGFVGFDTANQPKHYAESLVGDALRGLPRGQFFLQSVERRRLCYFWAHLFLRRTKFTPLGGHDERVPYATNVTISEMVRQSVAGSLVNLRTDYLDSLLMHSPFEDLKSTLLAWRAFEDEHDRGRALRLGISNVDFETFQHVYAAARVKPSVVQNRFYARTGYDRGLRAFCAEHGIEYQGFWTLTANKDIVNGDVVHGIAQRLGRPVVSVFYAALKQLGVVVLDGTKDEGHMADDSELLRLDEADVAAVDAVLV